MKKHHFIRSAALIVLIFSLIIVTPWSLNSQKRNLRPLRPGEESRGPWWMKATALNPEGRLPSLRSKKWWKKTLDLKPGEVMILEEGGEARDRMAVRLESYELEDGQKVEVLVWIIDDDGNGSLKTGGDHHDDCYLYDLNRDGWVDLMVDYVDENDDRQPDFLEIRYFERGYLTQAWFGYDFEGIGEIIKFNNPLELMAEIFTQNLNGRKLHFKNAYHQGLRSWRPAGLCPLASFDLDSDGLTDLLVRVNLEPGSMASPIIASLEISYDVGRSHTLNNPFHYDLGLVLVGKYPFDLDENRLFSARRRPPQEVYSIPYDRILHLLKAVQVEKAGLSWREFADDSLERNKSWKEQQGQGIGWSWERYELPATSPCIQKWNVRREVAFSAGQAELYFNEADNRIHLYGAREGWLPLGYLAGLPRIGEIRYFDTDGNGYFDRREIYLASSTRPVLVLPMPEDKNTRLLFDLNQISEFYLNKVLPTASNRTESMVRAMKKIHTYDPPPGLNMALERVAPGEKYFLQELYSLLYFIDLRDHLLTVANQVLFQELPTGEGLEGLPVGDLHPRAGRDPKKLFQSLSSDRAWKLARLLTELELAYSHGQLEQFENIVDRIKELGF